MGKNKNKVKNNGAQVPQNNSNKTDERPTIVVRPSNEIATTEEGEELLNNSLAEMDSYCRKKREEADQYYESKKAEADDLEAKKQSEIDAAVERAVKEKEKSMKQGIEEAEKKAKSIVDEAEQAAKDKLASFEERENQLTQDMESYTRQIAELDAKKISYKREMLDSIKAEMDEISSEKVKLENEIDKMKKSIRKKDIDIAALEEDKAFYEEQLSANSVRRAEIVSYKTKIDDLQQAYNKLEFLYKEQQERLQSLNAQILLYGDDPQKALKDNAELIKKNAELQNLISGCPSAEELASLRETSKKFEELNNKLSIVDAERIRLEAENNDLKVSRDEIDSYRKFIKILELQKAELQKELDRNIELYNNRTEKVFASLSLIDNEPCDDYPPVHTNLRRLCNNFRGYLANRPDHPLYYDDRTIRTFIAGFASSRIMILEGLSGTGKSSLPKAFGDFCGAKIKSIAVQSSWKDRNDLLGFYNDFKKQYKETDFLKALYTATHDPNNIYIIMLDEMNLSRIEYYFADLLSVLEDEKVENWKIDLIPDFASISTSRDAWPKKIIDGKLQICDNTWFVGTANKDDSTFIITDKVYDRSVVLNFDKKGVKEKADYAVPMKLSSDDFQALLIAAKKFKPADEAKFRDMINNLDEEVKSLFEITFGNRIFNQLETFVPVYVECGGTVDEAVDIMFSRKILRKLDGIYDEKTKENLEYLKETIEGDYEMPLTVATLEKMIAKI